MRRIQYIISTFCLFTFVQTQTLTNPSTIIDSSENSSNSITLAGASIGITTGTSMFLIEGIAGQDVNGLEAIALFLGPSFINSVVIPNYLESKNKGHLRTGMLLSSCATTLIPLLGPIFGRPDSSPKTVAIIISMGAVGGAVYNHILALLFPKYKKALKSVRLKEQE